MFDCLTATKLCDFNTAPEIHSKAIALAGTLADNFEKTTAISHFVKEFRYIYEDWSVSASDTLKNESGMCSGKTNLLVAMLRSLGIPARYRVFRVKAESELFNWLMVQDQRIEWANYVRCQDHVVAEVLLKDILVLDLSRDTAYELGLQKLGIPLELKPASREVLLLDSFDEWAMDRQKRRQNQRADMIYSLANKQLEKIRTFGIV
jgi:transglutaminase-like putative cysteine protease